MKWQTLYSLLPSTPFVCNAFQRWMFFFSNFTLITMISVEMRDKSRNFEEVISYVCMCGCVKWLSSSLAIVIIDSKWTGLSSTQSIRIIEMQTIRKCLSSWDFLWWYFGISSDISVRVFFCFVFVKIVVWTIRIFQLCFAMLCFQLV